jgi:acyl-CoA thioesterase-1
MTRYDLPRRLGAFGAAAAAVLLTIAPLGAAETSARLTTPSALPSSAAPAPTAQGTCVVTAAKARFDHALVRIARRMAAGQSIKIVALGSSSTAGAGASSPTASYPSQLALELAKRFPGYDITVLNRGVNGEEAPDMLDRFETSVVAEQPDLVIWQLGTNWVLRDRPIDPGATVLHEGLQRLKAIGADVVLIDPQFAPRVIAKAGTEDMVAQIAAAAKAESVDLFRRFDVMRHWREVENLPFDTFVSADGLHMNDWSYSCLAKWLAAGIAEAATRPTATASAPRSAR